MSKKEHFMTTAEYFHKLELEAKKQKVHEKLEADKAKRSAIRKRIDSILKRAECLKKLYIDKRETADRKE